MISKKDFRKISDWLWEIPKEFRKDMRVPARIYASEKLLEQTEPDAITQVVNVATLPGIINYSFAMPDIHTGYGFVIGGVAATDVKGGGVISPGGVGYDIACSVRLLRSEFPIEEIKPQLDELATSIQKEVPSGLGRGRQIKLSVQQIDKILEGGVPYLVEQGYGEKEDVEYCEEKGKMKGAAAVLVSDRAKNRGRNQVGTLGSGNHFAEIQLVDEIFDEETAKTLGLFKKQVVIMVHCGSRGLGHQIATDYIRVMMKAMEKYKIQLPDRELACAPFSSSEAQNYFSAMQAGANFSWANRHMITHYVRQAWKEVLGKESKLELVYDVSHNTAKLEDGMVVHRKGATRAFPPGHHELPEKHKEIGQVVLIPGSMGTASYVLVGQKEGEQTFYSTCFSGDTKIITDRGIFTFKEIYKRFNQDREQFLVPSLNTQSRQFAWKPIEKVMVREAPTIEISISQQKRETLNKLKVTNDHKFITLSGTQFIEKEISKIIEQEEAIFLLDNLPSPYYQFVDPKLAYVVGALITDGSIYAGSGKPPYPYNGRKITFIQKKTPEKLNFINCVQANFQSVFGTPLREYKTRTTRSYIRGRLIEGSATDFVCTQAQPIQQLLAIEENLISWVLSLSEEAAFNFLAGAIDGDGTWHPNHKIINIFNGGENETVALVLACLKLGILPYVSKQRGSCYVIQISEKIDNITKYTKRVKSTPHLRKYGTKLFSVRQLFKGVPDVKWPFLPKIGRNSLISKEVIEKFLFQDKKSITRRFKINRKRYSQVTSGIEKIISAPLRMQRVHKTRDLYSQEVFNITVKDNHNYIVLTDLFLPLLVANCHGAGRTMSRHEAMRRVSGQKVVNELESKGILVKCWSLRGIAEEAPIAYKNVDEVVDVVHSAGLSKKVARLVPLAVIKGE